MTSASTGSRLPMAGAVEALTADFAGVYGPETVRGVLADSAALLGRAGVMTHQSVRAYRFARQRLADTAASSARRPRAEPTVLFVCSKNAGRSQLAAALLEHAAAGRVVVRSAGTGPADQLHDAVVDALAEAGVDSASAFPKPLAPEALEAADVVVTLGCGDVCPVLPGRRYLDWDLPDPAAADADGVRALRDDIAARVSLLLRELLAPPERGQGRLDDALLRLLGDPLRVRIVELLSAEALCTSHLVEMTGAKQTNISNHLRLLRDAGLLRAEPCGRFTYNVLRPEPLRQLSDRLAVLADAAETELPRRTCP